MRHCGFTAIFAHGKRRCCQSVVASALVAPASGFVLLWNSHEFFSEKFTLSAVPILRDEIEGQIFKFKLNNFPIQSYSTNQDLIASKL